MTKAIVSSAAKPRRNPSKIKITPIQREEDEERQVNKHWRTYFLQKLAETSNVKASAA